MPFLSESHPLSEDFRPVPIEFFIRWRDTYLSRNVRFHIKNGKTIVDLSDENLFVTFEAAAIKALISGYPNGKFLTTQFMCEGNGTNNNYNKLSAAMCIMESENPTPLSDFILPILSPIPTHLAGKANYQGRKAAIYPLKNKEEFWLDEDGIAHEINDGLREYFAIAAMKKINVTFVKIPYYETDVRIPPGRRDKMTVVFAEEGIDIMDDQALRSTEMKLYDFGGGCCPPA